MKKSIFSVLTRLLISLPVMLFVSSALAATDLSYPPPGTSIRYVDKRHGEQNIPRHVDRLDSRSGQTSHTIIQPGYRPVRSDQQAAAAKPSLHKESLYTSADINVVPTGRPLLWKLDSPGIASNYILATIHLDDERIMRLSDTVLSRLRSADRLLLELRLDQHTSLDVMRKMIFTDGRTLQQVIGEKLYTQVSDRITNQGGIANSMLSILKPWAAMIILLRPDNNSGTFLDKHLGQLARNDRIPVLGLETIDEQLSAFDRITLDDQASLLRSTLQDINEKDTLYRQLLAAYIEGDLSRISAISDASQPQDERLARLFSESLITQRNKLMYQRMLPYLQQGNSFIAVGALHLPGEQGLLAMLKQYGYTLTRLEYGM